MNMALRQVYNNFAVLVSTLLIATWSSPGFSQTLFEDAAAGPVRSEMATTNEEPSQGPRANSLTAEAVDLLRGQKNLPVVSHLDSLYKRGRHSSRCTEDWKKIRTSLRRSSFQQKPFEHNLGKIEANARRMNVWSDHLKKTLATFKANQDQIPNQRYISFINFNRRSNQKRFYIVDLQTGSIKDYHVAAGRGSDPDGNGFASKFSNVPGSKMSSLGCAIAGGQYSGKNKRPSLILHGFSPTNDRSCDRSVVMHPAGYVGGVPGRSYGCPAVRNQDRKEIYSKVTGGIICSFQDGHEYEATHKKSGSSKIKKKSNTRRYKMKSKKRRSRR